MNVNPLKIIDALKNNIGKTVAGTALSTALISGVVPWESVANKLHAHLDNRYVSNEIFESEMKDIRNELEIPKMVETRDPHWLPLVLTKIETECS